MLDEVCHRRGWVVVVVSTHVIRVWVRQSYLERHGADEITGIARNVTNDFFAKVDATPSEWRFDSFDGEARVSLEPFQKVRILWSRSDPLVECTDGGELKRWHAARSLV